VAVLTWARLEVLDAGERRLNRVETDECVARRVERLLSFLQKFTLQLLQSLFIALVVFVVTRQTAEARRDLGVFFPVVNHHHVHLA